jgi:thioredoxin-like negative regulator of GroEL
LRRAEPSELDRLLASPGPLAICCVRARHAPSDALLAAVQAAGRVEVVSLDVDASPSSMDRWRIFKIPELLLVAGGRIVERTAGEMTAAQVRALYDEVFGS